MSIDTAKLQVYLKLNELRQGQNSTKEAHDFSKNEYHGVVQGQATPTADDRFGSCLNIGAEDSIKITKSSQSRGIDLFAKKKDSFTLGFWIKPTEADHSTTILSVCSDQHNLKIIQNKSSWQVAINGKEVIDETSSGEIKNGEWNHLAIAVQRSPNEAPKIEVYLNSLPVTVQVDDKLLRDLTLKNCVIEIAPQAPEQKFIGQVAHLRVYNGFLSVIELQQELKDDETATAAFNKSHPIEFDLHNENDEQVLYITDKEEQNLILEITNTSSEDIEFQVPKTDADWNSWKASESYYHFQLSFRPGTLSKQSTELLQSPTSRLLGLSQGWDCVYDPDDKNLVDWISFLWIGEAGKQLVKEIVQECSSTETKLTGLFSELTSQIQQVKDKSELLGFLKGLGDNPEALEEDGSLGEKLSDDGRYGISRKSTGTVELSGIGAAAGGGARGTRVHLKYDRLGYYVTNPNGDATQLPSGTRSQFLNIINRQGKATIPLHVGFVGSNAVLNDGQTKNELTLRVTNFQDEALSLEGGNGSPQFRVYFDFEDRSKAATQATQLDNWQQEWSIASLENSKTITVEARDPDDQEAWKIGIEDLQTSNPYWLLEPLSRSDGKKFAPRESFEFLIQNLVSDAPDGSANLYVEYKNIPGYWDGRMICSIEKAPLVCRHQAVGIGTDVPKAKLHVSVEQENAGVGLAQQKPAAIFEGGSVGIGVAPKATLHIKNKRDDLNKPAAVFEGGNIGIGETNPTTPLHVNGTVTATEFVGLGAVVKGMIVMWSGKESEIPAGWKLCDGDNRTPDLRSRFIVGAGVGRWEDRPSTPYTENDKGNPDSHNHSINALNDDFPTSSGGEHTHKFPPGWYKNGADKDTDISVLDTSNQDPRDQSTESSGWHSHRVRVTFAQTQSGDHSKEIRPRWYALCLIMYVGSDNSQNTTKAKTDLVSDLAESVTKFKNLFN